MAPFLALMASILWGTSDFLGGTFSRSRKVIPVVAASQALSLTIAIPLVMLTGAWRSQWFGKTGFLLYAIVAGLFGYLGLILFYAALSRGTMGVVSPIASFGVLLPVVAGLVRGEVPTSLQILGIAIAIIGGVLASGPEIRGEVGFKPVLLALGAGMGFGTAQIFMGLGSQQSAIMTMTMMRVTTFTVMGAVAIYLRSLGGLKFVDIKILWIIGAFDFSANVFLGIASHMGMWSVVMVIGSLYPIATILLAAKFHHERLKSIQYFGISAALLGVCFLALGN